MKCSESWLREWVNPKKTLNQLADNLTMSGLEVEELAPVAQVFSGVVIGQILKIEKHPEADRLNICEVDAGQAKPLHIVCGASNARVGINVPVATLGAVLPNNLIIKATKIRNVPSEGMLCSASELGLAEASDGLLELPPDAPLGKNLRDYLQLDDYTIDVGLTPNRGDCLSIRGMAREVSALTQAPLTTPNNKDVAAKIKDVLAVSITAPEACPRYVGRVIKKVNAAGATPIWMQERLRRSGIRHINPIVDVTNYVMLELGQPMHAFDLNKITNEIQVRWSKQNETIALLDGTEKTLDAETLVIADAKTPLAIAGVMGGLGSGVTTATTDIFLESAYFSPRTIARQRQFYNLNSDSAYRFERGIDYTMQREAIERATQLILDIAGGEAGPVIEQVSEKDLPKTNLITFSHDKIAQILGVTISPSEVEKIFQALKFTYEFQQNTWHVTPPTYRSDLTLQEDIVEEIARLYGYDKIPTNAIKAQLQVNKDANVARDFHLIRQAFSNSGYHEVISYSFVDKKLQNLLDPQTVPKEILNPITADMTVMRTNLWPGLINTLLYNKSRQQHRIRLFELGTTFNSQEAKLIQQPKLAGLISGLAAPEQWGIPTRKADFFDLKGDLESILKLLIDSNEIIFKQDQHPALHPGQTAAIYAKDTKIGIVGLLHPLVSQALEMTDHVYIFELDLNQLPDQIKLRAQEISKFPEIRRDLAILVNEAVPAKDIQDTIKMIAGDWLKGVFIFDVYQGKGISPGLKSIALGLVLQHPTRTLVDDEITALMEKVIATLKGKLGAELRS